MGHPKMKHNVDDNEIKRLKKPIKSMKEPGKQFE